MAFTLREKQMTKIVDFSAAKAKRNSDRDGGTKPANPDRTNEAHILDLARALIYSTVIKYDHMLANEIYEILWERFKEDGAEYTFVPATKGIMERIDTMDQELLVQWVVPYEMSKLE